MTNNRESYVHKVRTNNLNTSADGSGFGWLRAEGGGMATGSVETCEAELGQEMEEEQQNEACVGQWWCGF